MDRFAKINLKKILTNLTMTQNTQSHAPKIQGT